MNRGEVWFVEFPVEEIAGKTTNRPVVVLDEYLLEVLSVKITKHKPRKDDLYDIPILYWEEAGLRLASTARVSKTRMLIKDNFLYQLGKLCEYDLNRIETLYKIFLGDKDAD